MSLALTNITDGVVRVLSKYSRLVIKVVCVFYCNVCSSAEHENVSKAISVNAPRMIQYRLLTLVPGAIALAVFLAIAILPPVSHAQTSNGAGGKTCKPVEIETTVTVEEIFDVDVRNTSFKAILNLNFRWRLPPKARELLKVHEVYQASEISAEIWQPIYTVRASRSAPLVDYSYFYMTRDRYGVRQDRILTDVIMTGEFRDFPFGQIPLEIQLETLTNIAHKSDIKLCRTYSLSLAKVAPLVVGPWQLSDAGSSTASEVSLSIQQHLQHTPVFIFFKIIVPLLVLTFISAMTNINIGRSPDAARWIVVQVTVILVLITLRFALDGVLPEESYLTIADKMFVMALIAVFFAITSSLALHVAIDNFNVSNERRFKVAYRLVVMLFYLFLATAFAGWTGMI